ncbi:MAG: carbohydrate kinase family protein [Anaerolineaceae bacterium]|nr:carbohydrate kinase family protein [Anaerolineaceae bacterium]
MRYEHSCLVIGDINIDFNIHANSYPPEGGEIHAERSVFHLGGSGCSTARVLQKLGVPTALAANTGTDVFAEFAMRQIGFTGLDTSLVQQLPDEPTGFFMILVTPGGQRTMFGNRGANAGAFPLNALLAKVEVVDHLHISGYSLLVEKQYDVIRRAVQHAKALRKTISLDPGYVASRKAKDKVLTLLPFIDYFLPSSTERDLLAGEANEKDRALFLLAKGCGALILKQAEKGSRFVSRQMDISAPAFSIKGQKVYDSTGAGDSFNAGFLYGILTGESPALALKLGNAAGYAAITKPNGILDMVESVNLKNEIFNLSKIDS